MFETKTGKKFHARWYTHGVFTMLQETAHPQELFLLDECDNPLLESIFQKVNLRTLGPDEADPTQHPQTHNDFFTR